MYLCRATMDNLPIKQLERNAAATATSDPLWDEILIRRWIGQVYLYFNMCVWRFVFGTSSFCLILFVWWLEKARVRKGSRTEFCFIQLDSLCIKFTR